jgi:hypothetical protein
MKMRSLIAALTMAVGTFGIATATHAARVVEVEIGVAPPAPPPNVVVVEPVPREGFIYEPGHYGWDGQRYVWIEQQYVPNREGHHWRRYTLERSGDRWHYRAGHWDDDD